MGLSKRFVCFSCTHFIFSSSKAIVIINVTEALEGNRLNETWVLAKTSDCVVFISAHQCLNLSTDELFSQ